MYEYVTDKKFIKRMRKSCGEIMQDLCHTLKQEYDIGAQFYLIGSGDEKLILQNASEPIDLDYNLEIVRCADFDDCRHIKECVRKAFNMVLRNYGLRDCQDSTSSLTTYKMYFQDMPSTPSQFANYIYATAKKVTFVVQQIAYITPITSIFLSMSALLLKIIKEVSID